MEKKKDPQEYSGRIQFEQEKLDYEVQLRKLRWWERWRNCWLFSKGPGARRSCLGCLGYLLLFLLLLLLLFFLLRSCRSCSDPDRRDDGMSPYFPPDDENVIVPIDSTDIGYRRDSVAIATDRLNIILYQENPETFNAFADKFKQLYPDSKYKISYYDLQTYRITIQVPPEEREEIKRKLPGQMPEFDFCVYDETLFGASGRMTDPGFDDTRKSWYFDAVRVSGAWDVTAGDPDIIVAVADNGFDLSHPELAGKIVKPYNVFSKDSRVYPVAGTGGMHGTHVAATAVGNSNNGSGVCGIAPGCRLMPVQLAQPDGIMPLTAVIDGILYAVNQGADVVNASVGIDAEAFQRLSPGEQLNFIRSNGLGEEEVWKKIHEIAAKKHCVIVWAAGNENVIAGIDPSKRYPNGIKVSAVGRDLEKAGFSNYGNYADYPVKYSTLSAPGVAIYNAVPEGRYAMLDGTSMAAPIVAGAVALLKSVDRSLTAEQAIDILTRTGLPAADSPIGPVIQLDRALQAASGKNPLPPDSEKNRNGVDCDSIARRIGELKKEIERLRKLCPECPEELQDTLKMSDVLRQPTALNGLWKSTTELCNDVSEEPIELYMKFENGSGQLIIVESGNDRYTAPLEVKVADNQVRIRQLAEAENAAGERYNPYSYVCSADKNDNLDCEAYLGGFLQVKFNLIKVKEL